MRILKNILIYALPALMLCNTSCDYLDKEPENKVPEENVDFTQIENMYQAVSGVYAKVRTGGMHWVIWPLSVVRDDDVWSGRIDDQATLIDMGNYNYDSSFWGLNEMWNQYYGIIKVANAALESLDSYAENITSDDDMTNYRSYCGEVRFLRAYAYYRLVQAFGPVTILRSNTQTDMTRSTINAVYKYVLEDLQYTMDHTPRLRPNEMAHYGAVTAFSAEMLESLFECQCTDFGLGSGDMVDADNWFVFQGPANDGNISGWGFIGIYKDFRDWAAARGETIRATTSFLLAGTTTPSGDVIRELQNSTQTDCWNGKAYTPTDQLTPGRTKYGANNNVRIFRYADVLLMNAEAKVRLGKDGDAPLKLVRDRAKMSEIDNATVDQILDERRMELVCEWGERYNDLIRTGKAASVLGSKGWTEDKTYYPLPFDQVSNIPSLTNEPIDE